MTYTYVFAGLPVADFDVAQAWYERLVGRPPDLVPTAGEAAWQLTEPGWIYVVADAQRAGAGLLTVLVDDLQRQVEELAARGLDAGPIETVPGAVLRVTLADPDGNRVTLGQSLAG